MRTPKLIALALLSLVFSSNLFAQKKKREKILSQVTCVYGDVRPEDFAPSVYSIDSSADAVYLFHGGYTTFTGNAKGFFDMNYTVHERIRLLKKQSFNQLSSIKIHTYTPDNYYKEWISDLQATTYTLEGGQVVATKMDKSSIFKEKSGDYTDTKFTFPALKEGCIVEYTFTLHQAESDDPVLPGWEFQGQYPMLWSEYETVTPAFFQFARLDQGYFPYTLDTLIMGHDTYNIISPGHTANSFSTSLVAATSTLDHVWAIRNVPALKPDNFITTLEDYKSKIDFQLAAVEYPGDMRPRMVQRTWLDVSDDLMSDKDFAGEFVNGNHFFDGDVKDVIAGAGTYEEKAKRVYEYVRDKYTCTDHDARWLSQPLRKTWQTKKGNVADINLLLTAIYKSLDMEAYPVLLSTVPNGKAYGMYPIMNKFNYVITELILFNKRYLLDASVDKLGFNHLGADCYNGYAHVIDTTKSILLPLFADSLKENSITSVFIANKDAHAMKVAVNQNKGYQQSLSIRNAIARDGIDAYFRTMEATYAGGFKPENEKIENLTALDVPVKISYDLNIENTGEDFFYFNPLLGEPAATNPFPSADRYYPVDMPFCTDKTYVLMMEIPSGYEVAELPKSARVKLNDDEGMFEYIIANADGHIQLRIHLKLEKATYKPEDYQSLRDFYSFVIKKEEEQVVFKKVK